VLLGVFKVSTGSKRKDFPYDLVATKRVCNNLTPTGQIWQEDFPTTGMGFGH